MSCVTAGGEGIDAALFDIAPGEFITELCGDSIGARVGVCTVVWIRGWLCAAAALDSADAVSCVGRARGGESVPEMCGTSSRLSSSTDCDPD